MTVVDRPFSWVKRLEKSLAHVNEVPLFSSAGPFDLVSFEDKLQQVFDRPSLKITLGVGEWVTGDQVAELCHRSTIGAVAEWPLLKAESYLLSSDQSIRRLMVELLEGEDIASYFYEEGLLRGFYRYFVAEVVCALEGSLFIDSLVPRVDLMRNSIQEKTFNQPVFINDVVLSIGSQSVDFQLLSPEPFRVAWKEYCAGLPPKPLSEKTKENIEVDISLSLGYCDMSVTDWKEVGSGDFVFLNYCSYDPKMKKGSVLLSLNEEPLFRGRLKEESVKLTEYPVWEQREDAAFEKARKLKMEKNDIKKGLHKDASHMKEDTFPKDEADDFEDHFYMDEDDEDFHHEEEEEISIEKDLEDAEPEEFDDDNVRNQETEERPLVSVDNVPLRLVVEVGRLRMTVKEVMDLAPGVVLDMRIAPEQGVDLVVNGCKMGKGELVRIGDTIGVRILSL